MSDAHRDDIAKLESLYAEHPEGRIFTHLAEAYRKAGELGRAREVLEEGIARHPDYSSAHVVLGRVLLDEDRTGEAEGEFRRVLELDAHNLVAIRSLGDLARSRGDHTEALGYYHRLLDHDPDDEVRDIVDELTAELSVPASPVEGPLPGSGLVSDGASATHDGVFIPLDDDTGGPVAGATPEPGFDEDPALAGEEAAAPAGEDEVMPAGEEDLAVFGGMPAASADEDHPGWSTAVDGDADEAEAEAEDEAEDGFDGWIGGAPEEAGAGGGEDFMGLASSFDEPAGDAGVGPAPAPDEEEDEDDGAEVRTETIAQVYARQGLYDRAAEVYRELARSRPDDAGLRERLAEMEELAAADAEQSGEVSAVADFGGGMKPYGDGDGATEGEADSLDEPGGMLEGFEAAEVDTESVTGGSLEGLVVDEADPESGLRVDAAPDTADPEEDLSDSLEVTDTPLPPEETPWSHGTEDAGDVEEEEDEDEEVAVWTEAGDWDVEEATTPHAWTEEEDEADASPPIRSYFGSLLDWSGGSGPAGEGEASAAAASSDGPAEGAGSVEAGSPAGDDDDDDDLEMFRSWLESLKQ